MVWGTLTIDDGSGLSRAEKHALLYRLQGGRCAVCAADFPEGSLVGDHDHETGLLRGPLCRPCNVTEGKTSSLLFSTASPAFDAYRANPPAASLGWMWEDPEPLPVSDEILIATMRARVWEEPGRG